MEVPDDWVGHPHARAVRGVKAIRESGVRGRALLQGPAFGGGLGKLTDMSEEVRGGALLETYSGSQARDA